MRRANAQIIASLMVEPEIEINWSEGSPSKFIPAYRHKEKYYASIETYTSEASGIPMSTAEACIEASEILNGFNLFESDISQGK